MSVGTLSVINGSVSVTGTDTTFLSDLNSGGFVLFVIGGTTYTYPVISVESDTSLTLVDEFEGPTTEGVSYSAVPAGEMVSVPMQLIYQTTRAIRGLNSDKDNWQQVFSSNDEITITLPDGSVFTGPSWGEVSRGIDATNLEAANQIADRMEAAETSVKESAGAASASESAAAQSATNAATSEANAADSASQAADSLSQIGDSVAAAAQSASDAADSASAAASSEQNSATSESNAASSATAAAASEQSVADNATAAAASESNAADSAAAAATSADAAATSASNAATSESNASDSASSAAQDAQTATDSIQQTLDNAQTAQEQADRATSEADRAETEADKLGNTNDFAAILDTIDIDNADVTFKGNVAGADAVDDNDFVTLSQMTIATSHQPLNADTFADLADLVPAEAGHLAFLREYNSGTGYGGGMFIAVAGSATSDGGITQAVNDDFHWRRYIDLTKAEITMFGAVPDGATDCIDAVQAMFNWSLNSGNILQKVGVQLPAGEFVMSSMPAVTDQIATFRFVGLGSERYGYNNPTRIKLIGDADSYCFDLVSRWVEIGNIQLEGIAPGETETVVRHFLRNSITQGQLIRVSNMRVVDMGGRTFELIDTLDAKFDQIYGSRGHDNFLCVLASGELSWDHSTAIEISNSTFQSYVADSDQQSLLFIPNCTQAMMWNVWIEFCNYPGNITLGEWALHSVAMESNDNPLYAGQCRLATYSCSNANGAGIDTTTDMTVNNVTGEYESRTLSNFEVGQTLIYSHGIYANSALKASLRYAGKIYSNSGNGGAVWIRLGRFVGGATAEMFRIMCITRNGFATPHSTDGGLNGDSVITIQNRSASENTVTWNAQRNISGILDVRYEKPFASDTVVYVRLAPFSRVGFDVLSTGTTRVDAGQHSYVQWDMTVISDDDLAAIDDLTTPISSNSWGTTTAGIVADGDNNLIGLYTSASSTHGLTMAQMYLNGAVRNFPTAQSSLITVGHEEIATLPDPDDVGAWALVFTREFVDTAGTTHNACLVTCDGRGWHPVHDLDVTVDVAATAAMEQ